jgi:hypothetical protein
MIPRLLVLCLFWLVIFGALVVSNTPFLNAAAMASAAVVVLAVFKGIDYGNPE